jgi:hypothetical protein
MQGHYLVQVLDDALTDDFPGEVARFWDESIVSWTTMVQTYQGERFTLIPAGRCWDRKQALANAKRERG